MCVLIYAAKPVKELFVAKKTGGLGDDQMVLMDDLNLNPESVSVINYNLLKFLKQEKLINDLFQLSKIYYTMLSSFWKCLII